MKVWKNCSQGNARRIPGTRILISTLFAKRCEFLTIPVHWPKSSKEKCIWPNMLDTMFLWNSDSFHSQNGFQLLNSLRKFSEYLEYTENWLGTKMKSVYFLKETHSSRWKISAVNTIAMHNELSITTFISDIYLWVTEGTPIRQISQDILACYCALALYLGRKS